MSIYRIQHCKRKTPPEFIIRLRCEARFSHLFEYQDLVIADCEHCGDEVMAWIGIGYCGAALRYHRIAGRNHDTWIRRMRKDKVSTTIPRARVVNGCVRDFNSGHYIFRDNIPVR